MKRRYLAFDLEVATELPDDSTKWDDYRPFGIACAATLASDEREPKFWVGQTATDQPAELMTVDECRDLVSHLESAVSDGYATVTWNGLEFDFDVLAEESDELDRCKRLALAHLDMMFHVVCMLGHPVGLQPAAQAWRLPGKPDGVDGREVPGMWLRGEQEPVLSYVAQDVRTTLDIATKCADARSFRWIARSGKKRTASLPDGWLPVNQANALPEPDTSWMKNPIDRRRFSDWTRRS